MNIMIGDTIVLDDKRIGIVENRSGNDLTVRLPDDGNLREHIFRSQVKPLAEVIYEARNHGRRLPLGTNISLTGKSTLAELVALFGYSTGQMRRDSLYKVRRQLERAGIQILAETDRWSRGDKFIVSLLQVPIPVDRDEDNSGEQDPSDPVTTNVSLPEPFWPVALGLDPRRELEFLRALSESAPMLCLLHVPTEAQTHAWIQGAWEGIMGWAYRAAQQFQWWQENSTQDTRVRVGPAALLQTYLKPSALDNDVPRLADTAHTLNLIAIKRELEIPTDFARFSAIWPGPIFEFKPDYKGQPLTDMRAINECLSLAAGRGGGYAQSQSPLHVLNWARTAYAQLMTRPVTEWGGVVASNNIPSFKGSNECSTTLAIKAHLAGWVIRNSGDRVLEFECNDVEEEEEEGVDELSEMPARPKRRRIDLRVEGMGDYEVESMKGSGPMESFYHKKIFSRANKDTRFSLIVPTEAILWAGPCLSDLAHHLREKNGSVMIPSSDGAFLEITGKPLVAHSLEELRLDERVEPGNLASTASETPIRLADVAGYDEVRCRIDELIIWPERNSKRLRPTSRSSGILFFGPQGCGKTRWARAIAGELEQEVRLLAPSDLRGKYLGWGQIMIREQFDWLAENDKRMLIVDEFDAVARSRRHSQMHSDDQASVNELLVQVDRVLRLGRLLAATTNFIDSMDDAVMRSGRFGRFIPVPPPNAQESVEIVAYYLKRLADQSDANRTSQVRVPGQDRLTAIIEPLFEACREDSKFYCVADLEEAVNRAYSRSARRAWPDGGWTQESPELEIHLTEDDLNRSLIEVPKSIRKDALDQFLEDLNRFCDREVAESISSRLRPRSET